MKKFILFFAITALSFATSSYAATSSATVNVSGLVCDFCARSVEKVFGKQDAVSDVKVDLDAKTVAIHFKDNQTIDDATITKLITDSGYNVVSINRAEGNKK